MTLLTYLLSTLLLTSHFCIADIVGRSPQITAAPILQARQNGDNFIGWTTSGTDVYSFSCLSGRTYVTNDNNIGGCTIAGEYPPVATTCRAGTIFYISSSETCIRGLSCQTVSVFSSLGAAIPNLIYRCGSDSFGPVYRTLNVPNSVSVRPSVSLSAATTTASVVRTGTASSTGRTGTTQTVAATQTSLEQKSTTATAAEGTRTAATTNVRSAGNRAVEKVSWLFALVAGVVMIL